MIANAWDPDRTRARRRPRPREGLLDPERASLLYTGRFGSYGRDPAPLVEALGRLAASSPELAGQARARDRRPAAAGGAGAVRAPRPAAGEGDAARQPRARDRPWRCSARRRAAAARPARPLAARQLQALRVPGRRARRSSPWRPGPRRAGSPPTPASRRSSAPTTRRRSPRRSPSCSAASCAARTRRPPGATPTRPRPRRWRRVLERSGRPEADGAERPDQRAKRVPDAVAPPPTIRASRCSTACGRSRCWRGRWSSTSGSSAPVGDSLVGRLVLHLNIGVTIFFLISGFLLYRPFIAHRTGGGEAPASADYARRRLLRIVPAYWLVLIVLILVPGLTGVPGDGGDPAVRPPPHAADRRRHRLRRRGRRLRAGPDLEPRRRVHLLRGPAALRARRRALARGRSTGSWLRAELALLAVLSVGSVAAPFRPPRRRRRHHGRRRHPARLLALVRARDGAGPGLGRARRRRPRPAARRRDRRPPRLRSGSPPPPSTS